MDCPFTLLSSDACISAIIGGFVGAIAATVGTWILWRTQIRYEEAKKKAEEMERNSAAGHKAMMTLESQWTFVEGLKKARERYGVKPTKAEEILEIRASYVSVPRVQLDNLGFLAGLARDSNTLPKLGSLQQNFDQMIDSLNHVADERRALYFAKKSDTDLFNTLAGRLFETDARLSDNISKLMAEYPKAQVKLQQGLLDAIQGFIPIYTRQLVIENKTEE